MCSPFTWLSPTDYRNFRTAEVPADTSVNSFVACCVRLKGLISTTQKIKEEAQTLC